MAEAGAEAAARLDASDPLGELRAEFHFPEADGGGAGEVVYLAGNSLGLQPRRARRHVEEAMDDWARRGVEGHFRGEHPWMPYHELVTGMLARLLGAEPSEVVAMNSLTVNLHLMMVSFYRPTAARHRVLMEAGAFPSDRYAVASQVRFHGFDPDQAIQLLAPRPGEHLLRPEDVLATIERNGQSIALVLLGNVNYLTGQAYDIGAITRVGHARGCVVGFDLAHAAGNLPLALHDDAPDFAVFCTYKYLNAGPGAIAGCFVHQRHHRAGGDLPRLAGWWGHDKATRFEMGPQFQPIPGAEGWQLSNPPILPLAALRGSLELFDAATMRRLRAKSVALTGYLERLIEARLPAGTCQILTPRDPAQRGAQLSLRFPGRDTSALQAALAARGVICDFRAPDILRAAPVPLYNRFLDVHRFVEALEAQFGGGTGDR